MLLPQPFIKNVALQMHSDLKNTPYPIDGPRKEFERDKGKFIGRKHHLLKFEEFLKGSKRGVYLVTGFRGMGKTSFVNHAIRGYKWEGNHGKSPHQIRPVCLTLTQNHLNEVDILKLIVSSLYDQYSAFLKEDRKERLEAKAKKKGKSEKKEEKEARKKKDKENKNDFLKPVDGEDLFYRKKNRMRKWLIIFGVLAFLAILCVWQHNVVYDFIFPKNANWNINIGKWVVLIVLGISLGFFFYFLVRFYKYQAKSEWLAERDSAYNRIKKIMERSHSMITREMGLDDNLGVQGLISNITPGRERRSSQYPLAGAKEIEYELHQFLRKAKNEVEFIFIFDELDKIEQAVNNVFLYADMDVFERQKKNQSAPMDAHNRKQAILNAISGLKNFFTTAEARFVFIAGHEMFDASMADIADRQSSVSSIFTYIFNIESLLKERNVNSDCQQDSGGNDDSKNNHSLAHGVEAILSGLLFGEGCQGSLFELIVNKYEIFSGIDPAHKEVAKAKIYFVLQNFVTYLVYRSNGSPKKLIRAIHEMVLISDDRLAAKGKSGKCIVAVLDKSHTDGAKEKYLYFNYYNQYRIGFISYLYRPFLIQYGRSFKIQSDNMVLSTPYLFDHLFKFHPFAFSLSNLEQIPEVLSTSKTVSLRDHLKKIIDYLSTNHLRQTEIGLFDYKFYSRIQNEISFLSKIFEEEAAAFNFTLDESYLVKVHINNKIKELRSIYAIVPSSPSEKGNQIYSIANLNENLGDLHFFDQEYDDAITTYSDAIRPINHIEVSTMNMRDFITLIRNKLKLGLCFEKIGSYEESLAFYGDACQDAKRFIVYRLINSKVLKAKDCKGSSMINGAGAGKNIHPDAFGKPVQNLMYKGSSLSDLLQVIIQAFLAKIIVQEKMGIEGINMGKLGNSLGSFLHLSYAIGKSIGKIHNHLVIANSFLLTGKLMYFKNSPCIMQPSKDPFKRFPPIIREKINLLRSCFDTPLGAIGLPVKRKPVLALYFYLLGLDTVFGSRKVLDKSIINLITDNRPSPVKAISILLQEIEKYLESKDESFTGYHCRYIANLLSCIGDCLFSMVSLKSPGDGQVSINAIFDESMLSAHKPVRKFPNLLRKNNAAIQLSDALQCYYLSGQYFLKNGRSVSCSFQYRKIMHILRMVISQKKEKKNSLVPKQLIYCLSETLVKPTLNIISQNSGYTDVHMHNKAQREMEAILEKEHTTGGKSLLEAFSLSNISNHPETKEILLSFNYIKVNLGIKIAPAALDSLVSPYHSIADQFCRVLELDFFGKYLNSIEGNECDDSYWVNSLYCVLSILRILKIYERDYMVGSSYTAYTHLRTARLLSKLEKRKEKFKDVKKEIDHLLGAGAYGSLDSIYHYEMAKESYEKSSQLHKAGTEYNKAISEMIYLEDDFNDNAYHFGAAVDRYLMINGVFDKRISECKKKTGKNILTNPKKYLVNVNPNT